jgi:cytochrome c biogenesis protein CcdA
MRTDLPPPPGDPGDAPKGWAGKVLITIAGAVALGGFLGLVFSAGSGGESAIAVVAYLAVLAVPVVAVVAGVRRAKRHPGTGGREFLSGCLLMLALELGIAAIVFGACLVAAESMF